jgi:uncharacterized protein
MAAARLDGPECVEFGQGVRYYSGMKPSEALATHRTELRRLVSSHNLTHPRVFGSVLTGTDTEQSDLDLLVDPSASTTLFTLARLEHQAEQLLKVRVSVLTPGFLSMKFRDRVLEQAQPL